MKILVRQGTAVERTINSQGKAITFREQEAALDKGDGSFPHPFTISLGRDQAPYAPGEYELDMRSLEVGGQYQRLQLGRNLLLKPLASRPVARAAG